MSIFDNMLGSEESLFRDTVALDYDYIPKLIPHREKEQKYAANCIKPLFSKRNGKNLLIHGLSGVGKTVACRHIFQELEEKSDSIIPIYVNCWQKNTTYKIMLELCSQLGYKFTQNKKSDELFKIVRDQLNKKSVVFCFDEIDKAEDLDFLYGILEEVYRKTILMITNHKDWIFNLDSRLKSRLIAETLHFKPYNDAETKDILKQRMQYAFVPGVFSDDAFELIVKKTAELEDIRSGLYLMKEAGNLAEDESSKKITIKHVQEAIKKLDDFSIKKSTDLDEEAHALLDLIKANSGLRIGELFEIYQKQGGKSSYKTFQRKIDKLGKGKFISLEKITGGKEGNTTIVKYSKVKTLSEF